MNNYDYDPEACFRWYKDLNLERKFKFWYTLFEDEINDMIIKSFLNNEFEEGKGITKEEIVEIYEDDEYKNIPDYIGEVDTFRIEIS